MSAETGSVRVSVGVVGDYDPGFPPHPATDASLRHSAARLGVELETRWLGTRSLESADVAQIASHDALLCAPGSPYRSLDGALWGVRVAREHDLPFLGTCGGFQHAVIEYARNVLGFEDAQHAEYNPYASKLFISELACSLAGQTMEVRLAPDSRAASLYGATRTRERYYCDFGLNPEHRAALEAGGLRVSGSDQDGEARVLELPGHRFYLATLFVPQSRSSPDAPHPLLTGLLQAAVDGRRTGISPSSSTAAPGP